MLRKIIIFCFLLISLVIFGCAPQEAQEQPQELVQPVPAPGGQEEVQEMEVLEEETSSDDETEDSLEELEEPEAMEEGSTVKEFKMTAKRWEFIPSVIEVNQGDTVKIEVKSIDVTHGISISAFGVNEQLRSGKTVNLEFVADKKGEFSFVCSVFCGSGHGGMKGMLVVK